MKLISDRNCFPTASVWVALYQNIGCPMRDPWWLNLEFVFFGKLWGWDFREHDMPSCCFRKILSHQRQNQWFSVQKREKTNHVPRQSFVTVLYFHAHMSQMTSLRTLRFLEWCSRADKNKWCSRIDQIFWCKKFKSLQVKIPAIRKTVSVGERSEDIARCGYTVLPSCAPKVWSLKPYKGLWLTSSQAALWSPANLPFS